MTPLERLAAWLVTGPPGHLSSAVVDIAALWTRYLWHRYAAPGRWRSS